MGDDRGSLGRWRAMAAASGDFERSLEAPVRDDDVDDKIAMCAAVLGEVAIVQHLLATVATDKRRLALAVAHLIAGDLAAASKLVAKLGGPFANLDGRWVALVAFVRGQRIDVPDRPTDEHLRALVEREEADLRGLLGAEGQTMRNELRGLSVKEVLAQTRRIKNHDKRAWLELELAAALAADGDAAGAEQILAAMKRHVEWARFEVVSTLIERGAIDDAIASAFVIGTFFDGTPKIACYNSLALAVFACGLLRRAELAAPRIEALPVFRRHAWSWLAYGLAWSNDRAAAMPLVTLHDDGRHRLEGSIGWFRRLFPSANAPPGYARFLR